MKTLNKRFRGFLLRSSIHWSPLKFKFSNKKGLKRFSRIVKLPSISPKSHHHHISPTEHYKSTISEFSAFSSSFFLCSLCRTCTNEKKRQTRNRFQDFFLLLLLYVSSGGKNREKGKHQQQTNFLVHHFVEISILFNHPER